MLHSVVPELSLHCLPMSLLWDALHKWVKAPVKVVADIFFPQENKA